MISQAVILRLETSFGVERARKAIDKYKDKDFKNDYGAELYLTKVIEGDSDPKEVRKERYNFYRAENIYTELVKENGKDWIEDCMGKIMDFSDDIQTKIKNEARTHYWYCKRIGDYRSPLAERETEILGKMLASGKRKDGALTIAESDISEKVVSAWKKFDSEILCESMAVLFETRYKKQWEKMISDKNIKLTDRI